MAKSKFQPPREPKGLAAHVKNWATLLTYMLKATEDQLWALLEFELKNRRRYSTIFRIYGRAADLRKQRERRELHIALSKDK